MTSGTSFEEHDRRGASNFAAAAREAGVRRIGYLGGLGADGKLSSHLSSRQEVGRAHDLERVFDYRRDAVDRLLVGRRRTLAATGSGG